VGNDNAKNILLDETNARRIDTKGVISDAYKPTVQKIRVLGQSQQLLRIDYEDKGYISEEANKRLLERIKEIEKIDAIIVSDYAKGTMTKWLMQEIVKFANEKTIFLLVDPKPKHKIFYKNCSLITPNKKEAEQMVGFAIESKKELEKAGDMISLELDCDVLITTGEKGMSLFERGKKALHIPTVAKEVFDVSGAGDTVIAALGLAISSGINLEESAIIANHAAGVKVGKLGTAPVTLKELEDSLDYNA
jgi:D-beta-D-heptose 7-phosphate kinase/D-beta-D-heptose 1-phosphate adenosyltransferase